MKSIVWGKRLTAILAAVGIGFGIGSGLYGVLSALNPNWTIGYGIATFIDNHESGKKRANGYVFG